MRKVCPWLSDSDIPACRGWAQLQILGDLIFSRLRNEGPITSSGEAKKLVAEFRALKAAELTDSRELGLTPAARKAMAGDGRGFDGAEFAALNARQAETEGAAAAEKGADQGTVPQVAIPGAVSGASEGSGRQASEQ
jgi:hypothetical protein